MLIQLLRASKLITRNAITNYEIQLQTTGSNYYYYKNCATASQIVTQVKITASNTVTTTSNTTTSANRS